MLPAQKPFHLARFPLAKAIERSFIINIAPRMDFSRHGGIGSLGEREIHVADAAIDKALDAFRAQVQQQKRKQPPPGRANVLRQFVKLRC